jgi:hypothetical protein
MAARSQLDFKTEKFTKVTTVMLNNVLAEVSGKFASKNDVKKAEKALAVTEYWAENDEEYEEAEPERDEEDEEVEMQQAFVAFYSKWKNNYSNNNYKTNSKGYGKKGYGKKGGKGNYKGHGKQAAEKALVAAAEDAGGGFAEE